MVHGNGITVTQAYTWKLLSSTSKTKPDTQTAGTRIRNTIIFDGAYDSEKNIPLIDKFVHNPMQIQHQYGIGKTAIYIQGTFANGVKNRLALRLTFQQNNKINTTPFLQKLIGVVVLNTATK